MKKIVFGIIALSFVISFSACNKNKSGGNTEFKTHEPYKVDMSKVDEILKPEVLWMMGRLSEAQLSPDGKQIVYAVKYYNLDSNTGDQDLFIISSMGGEPKQLTNWDGNEFNVAWSEDGKKVRFISSCTDEPQIWEINADGSQPMRISDIKGGVNGFTYSPDGKKLAFIQDVKIDTTLNDVYTDLPKAEALKATELMYRHWNSWTDYAYSHIFIAEIKDGKIENPKDIMPGERFDAPMMPDGGMEQITWNPGSDKLVYTCKKMVGKAYATSTNSSLYEYNLANGETKNLLETGYDGYDMAAVFSPDGKYLLWESMKTDGFESDKRRMMLRDLNTGQDVDLSANFDQNCEHFTWDKDGKNIYFISAYHATFQLYKLNLESKQITQITKGNHDYTGFSLSNGILIGTKMNHQMPNEIFSIAEDGTEKQLTFTNKQILDKVIPAKTVERWVKTTDGKQMLVWVILPPNFDSTKTYPALLYCQGGPQSAVSQFYSFRWNFQMMASNGYIVVAPNRRGLPSFGQEWNDQISLDYGGQNMKDYLSAIDDVAKEKYVDKDHLGAIGASYGGYSVYYLAGNHDKRFKAFVAHNGIYNFESMYGATEETFFVNHDIGGAYWKNPKPKSYDYSPHKYVGKWDTPIMVITGEHDFRIPYTEGMQAFNAAQLQDIPAVYLHFPNETHFVLKPQNSVLWQREVKKFLDTYLK